MSQREQYGKYAKGEQSYLAWAQEKAIMDQWIKVDPDRDNQPHGIRPHELTGEQLLRLQRQGRINVR